MFFIFFFSSRRRHTRSKRDWSSDVCSSDLVMAFAALRDAVHYRDFWLLAGTYFVCGASTNGLIGTHLIPACIDHGFTEVTGAALLATMGVFNFVGTTSSGWLADKFDNRWLLFS